MWGHTPLSARDGGEALRVAPDFHPEIAVLDIGLPVMDGYELAPKLRALCGEVRLVAVNGYGRGVDRVRTAKAGFDAHLVKPVELDDLRIALDAAPEQAIDSPQ